MTGCLSQLTFSFYRNRPIHCDFSGEQITSEAGLLPLRAFDQRQHLTHDLAELLGDPREEDRVRHDSLLLLRQRIYQIIAGYEDANDADRLRHDPLLQQRTGPPATVTGARNLFRLRDLCESSRGSGSAAKAERVMVLRARVTAWLRYWRSLAWWQGSSFR